MLRIIHEIMKLMLNSDMLIELKENDITAN
jgi:hypothetical protein